VPQTCSRVGELSVKEGMILKAFAGNRILSS